MMSAANIFLFLSLSLGTLVACAEDPVSPAERKVVTKVEPSEILAVKFVGEKINETGLPLLRPIRCELFLAVDPEDGAAEDEDHGLLLTLNYREPDGHGPHGAEGQFYLFDDNEKKYFALDSQQANTREVLSAVSVIVEHQGQKEVGPGNPENIVEYIQLGTLNQSIRIDFTDTFNRQLFVQTIAEVLADEGKLQGARPNLEVVQQVQMILIHGDHPHYPKCHKFVVDGLAKVAFNTPHDHQH